MHTVTYAMLIGFLSIICLVLWNPVVANASILVNSAATDPAAAITSSSNNINNYNYANGESNIATITTTKKLNLVTSVAPIANIVKNIGGDKIELTQLIPD